MAPVRKIPMRQCLGCREMRPKGELVRIVHSPDGSVMIDGKGKAQGRGAYLCRSSDCLHRAVRAKAFDRAFGVHLPDEVLEALAQEMEAAK